MNLFLCSYEHNMTTAMLGQGFANVQNGVD